jgi:hypothetical protein
MNITKSLSTVGVGAAIVAGSMLAVTAASAHIGGGSEEDQAVRVTEFAERFDLEESEVKSYFDEKKTANQAEREAARAEQVAGLVEAGTLTQTQADELTALKDGFRAEAEALKDSGADRDAIKAAMEDNRSEVKAWAEAQGIDLGDIKPERGEGRGHGRGGSGPHGGADDVNEN